MTHDIYKIREKIGINYLDPEQRKKLFEEFVKHGGQVIDESKRPRGVIARKFVGTKGESAVVKEHKTTVSEKESEEKRTPSYPKTTISKSYERDLKYSSKQPKSTQTKKKYRLSDRIILYYKGFRNGVIGLNVTALTKNFIEFIENDCTNSLIDLNMAIICFLQDKTSIKQEIIRLSRGSNSTFYEFIVRLSYLYDEKEFNTIKKILSSRKIPDQKYLYLFKIFFKRFYILAQNTSISKLYIENALEIYKKKNRTDPEIITKMKAHLKACINLLFYDFFPKLHILLCLIAKRYYPLYSQSLDDFLEMTEKDRIGYITKIEKKRMTEMLKKRKKLMEKRREIEEMAGPSKQEESIEPPRHVQRGFNLINELISSFESKLMYDSENSLNLLKKDDKMYKTTVLTEIFEQEYSLILTTGKIQFNIDYQEQEKIDIKEDLSNAYIKFSRAREEIENYIDIIKEIKRTEENVRLTIYQKEVMQDKLEKKRAYISRTSRAMVAGTMKKIENILSKVIEDYRKSKRLLQNPDEILQFDPNIDGVKRLNNKKVIEAIVEAFLFSAAFTFMLKFGELSGSGLYIEKSE